MTYLKRFLFVLPHLGCWYWFLVMLKPFFTDSLLFLSFSSDILLPLGVLAGTLTLAALFHIVSGILGNDWRIVLPQGILASTLPLFVYPVTFALILASGFLSVLTLTTMLVLHTMRTYVHFSPTKLFAPLVRKTATFVLIVVSIGYFFTAQSALSREGFRIPESILDTALSFLSSEQLTQTEGQAPFSKELVKAAVSMQVEKILAPYYGVIPVILALLFFVTIQAVVSLIGLVIPIVLWLVFEILEKTRFMTYTVETRQVKRVVI